MSRKTLEDALIEANMSTEGFYECPSCKKMLPAFGLVDVSDITNIPHSVACGHCVSNANVETLRAQALLAPADTSWNSEQGLSLKSERNRLLDRFAWTIRPDSRLTIACLEEWVIWFNALNEMTINCPEPAQWSFPPTPTCVYMEQEAARLRFRESLSLGGNP